MNEDVVRVFFVAEVPMALPGGRYRPDQLPSASGECRAGREGCSQADLLHHSICPRHARHPQDVGDSDRDQCRQNGRRCHARPLGSHRHVVHVPASSQVLAGNAPQASDVHGPKVPLSACRRDRCDSRASGLSTREDQTLPRDSTEPSPLPSRTHPAGVSTRRAQRCQDSPSSGTPRNSDARECWS